MRCQPFGFVFHRNTEDFPKFSTLASPKMLMHLSTSHFLPRHPLHHVLTFLVLAQRLPRHLVIGDGFNLPPLAQFGIALILPARRQQRAVHEVVLELARGHGIPTRFMLKSHACRWIEGCTKMRRKNCKFGDSKEGCMSYFSKRVFISLSKSERKSYFSNAC